MSRKFLQGAAGWLASEFVSTWVWAPAITAVGVMIGWAQGESWFYLFVGAAVLFAAVSTGMLRFSEWRTRSSVAHKLGFNNLRIDKIRDESGVVRALRIGAMLSNKAVFPIAYELASVSTSIDKFYPPKMPYKKSQYTVPAGGSGWFDDHYIQIPSPRMGQVEGELTYELKYGKEGRLNNTLTINKKLFFNFRENGDLERVTWIDQ